MGNIRRSRGYSWEKNIEAFFNNIDIEKREDKNKLKSNFWWAKRLAPSSISLPDILVTYQDNLFAIEAKSSASLDRAVELRQIINGNNLNKTFPMYREMYVGIAWKFMSKTIKKLDRKKIRTFIILWRSDIFKQIEKVAASKNILLISCNYEGIMRYRTLGTLKKKGVTLTDKLDETDVNEYMNETFGKHCLKFTSFEKMVKTFKSMYE